MNGKIVIVTGASQGVGRALARTLAQRGCRLALAARNPGKLDEVVGECQEIGAEAIAVPTDQAWGRWNDGGLRQRFQQEKADVA